MAGLVLLLGEDGPVAAWRVVDGRAQGLDLADMVDVSGRVVALVPPDALPVRIVRGAPGATPVQAVAAARLSAQVWAEGDGVVAALLDETRVMVATPGGGQVAGWLGQVRAALGREADALVPAGLILPEPPEGGVSRGKIGPLVLVRGEAALFAGEAALWDALVPEGGAVLDCDGAALAQGVAACHAAPPFDLAGDAPAAGAMRRLALLAGLVGALVLALPLAQAGRWQFDVWRAEAAALARVRARFPQVADFAGAQALVARERAARQAGAMGWAPVSAALWRALRASPGVRLAVLGHDEDGTLHVTLGAGSAAPIDAVMLALQRDGWRLAPPPAPVQQGGEVLATITVLAP